MEEYGQRGDVMELTAPAVASERTRPPFSGGVHEHELRRLARWFDQSGAEGAHDLFTAAFGLYGARHWGAAAGHTDAVPAHTSWWHGPTAPVPAVLREGAARSPRGRAAALAEPVGQRSGVVRMPRHARPFGAAGGSGHEAAEAAERRAAARLLLAHPLITAAGPWAGALPLITRHASWLTKRFAQFLGYRLLVDGSCARLFKAGLGPGAGRCLLRPGTGVPFAPGAYAGLTLALSVLGAAAGRLPLGRLADGIREAAADAGIDRPDDANVVDALRVLSGWQVLGDTGGAGEALAAGKLTGGAEVAVDRHLVPVLIAAPLAACRDAADLVRRAAEPGPGGAERIYVRRRLAETPAVLLDELTGRERSWLRTRQRREAESFADFLGLQAEIRAEGVALLDPADELSDLDQPGTGTPAQAALLLTERLVEQLRPVPGDAVSRIAAGPVIGVPIPDAAIDGVLGDIADEYARRADWPVGYLSDRTALRRDVLELLRRMHLVAQVGPVRAAGLGESGGAPEGATDVRGARGAAAAGWVLLAPAARYAPRAAVHGAPPGRHARRVPEPAPAPRDGTRLLAEFR